MNAVEMRAGEDLDMQSGRVIQLGKDRWSLGQAGPILRAVGLGFALGLAAMTALTLLSS
jgi:hypothetical protein